LEEEEGKKWVNHAESISVQNIETTAI
jgi:hypothetical protein